MLIEHKHSTQTGLIKPYEWYTPKSILRIRRALKTVRQREIGEIEHDIRKVRRRKERQEA